jgi:hypothetical protein
LRCHESLTTEHQFHHIEFDIPQEVRSKNVYVEFDESTSSSIVEMKIPKNKYIDPRPTIPSGPNNPIPVLTNSHQKRKKMAPNYFSSK